MGLPVYDIVSHKVGPKIKDWDDNRLREIGHESFAKL